jgi:hypothetical protein
MTLSERQAALATTFQFLEGPYLAWATVAAAYAIEFLQPAISAIRQLELHGADSTRTQAALRCPTPSYFLGYTPMQIPAGFLVDRYGASLTSVIRSGHDRDTQQNIGFYV